jgi:hypothetical protein
MIHLFDDFPQKIILLLFQSNKLTDPGVCQITNADKNHKIANKKNNWKERKKAHG